MHAWEAIEQSLDYIEEHLAEKIDAKVLADRVFLSPFYFQRLFKRLVNKTVNEYICLRRLAVSVDLLKKYDTAIGDIAVEVGFSDHAHFTRSFKKSYHITPEDFRKKKPLMNVFLKPIISSQYQNINDDFPLIIGDIVLEIREKTFAEDERYIGFEKEVRIDQQVPVGEATGVDVPGALWQSFYEKKDEYVDLIHEGVEIGMSFDQNTAAGTSMFFFCIRNQSKLFDHKG
jgi:AraC family transcriptional regulator